MSRPDFEPCRLCETVFDARRARCPHCQTYRGLADTATVLPNGRELVDETVLLSEVTDSPIERIYSGPWDKAFGGGIVRTSVTLLGGAPGAGKSTMSLQIANNIADSPIYKGIHDREVLYVGAEEIAHEIKFRAQRLQLPNISRIRVLPMGSISSLGDVMMSRKPLAVMLDSLPGFTEDPIEAVKLCKALKPYAGDLLCPIIVIDHINKDGGFAGFIKLEHGVDTTLLLEVDEGDGIRSLSARKNRFGPTVDSEVLLRMTAQGLVLFDEDDAEEYEDES